MAQVVDYYVAVAGSRCYIRVRPEGKGVLQIEAGTPVFMWTMTMDQSHYRTYAPAQGFIRAWEVSAPIATYKTVTDQCTPPSAVTVSGKTMTIVGGAGGDLNHLLGWGVSWRDRKMGTGDWSEWSDDQTTASRTMPVTAPAGYVRQFRVRTLGSAGEKYYSDYTSYTIELLGNTAPYAPVVTCPANGAVTHSITPAIVLACAADPDGDAMTLSRQVDGGTWKAVATVLGTGGMVRDQLPVLGIGAHTVTYVLADTYGMQSESVTVTLTVSPKKWTRSITTGTVIANASISHKTDITELLAAINVQRAYYRLAALTLGGTIGRFGDWARQMTIMQEATAESLAVAGATMPAWHGVPSYPTAAIITQIRAAAEAA